MTDRDRWVAFRVLIWDAFYAERAWQRYAARFILLGFASSFMLALVLIVAIITQAVMR